MTAAEGQVADLKEGNSSDMKDQLNLDNAYKK